MHSASLDIEDHAQLEAYLRAAGRLSAGGAIEARTLSGGVSNRAVWVRMPDGAQWVVKQALAKLRTQADWFADPARIAREAEGLRACAELAPAGATPLLVFEDSERHIVAMTAVKEPHDNWKTLLLRGDVQAGHIAQFADMLGTLQRNAHLCAAQFAPRFADRQFFESLRLEPYYRYTASRVPQAAAFYDALIADTLAVRASLVHGDFSPKNVLVHTGRLVLVDYEVAHWGDPAFDVGFSMTHLLGKANHLVAQRADFLAAAQGYWARYAGLVDGLFDGLEARSVRHTLGCLLARVDGRSPLEYLTPDGRERQRNAALALIASPPASMALLIDRFGAAITSMP